MKIQEIINKMKEYHCGVVHGKPIQEETTRDKVLYGNTDQECTGIVTTCFASVDVIRKAHELGCNFIICHEALFWNHGDHTDWLQDNTVFQKKKALLDETGIVVWRDHDYIHSGIPVNGRYVDGIFYGLMKELHWDEFLIDDLARPLTYEFKEEMAGKQFIQMVIDGFGLKGVRIVGNPDTVVKKFAIPGHIMGEKDNEILAMIEKEDIDAILTMEITDFTVSEYFRDSAMLNRPRVIAEVGHFNLEEPGMKYMVNYVNDAIENHDLPVYFVPSTDSFDYILK
ncbi:MAG: Nif3-like dinuclear metal center hexameric protein [Erysipelotrichaceae bacterium]|nr:Nif3-like dinuclear metal center hexameric protein [Erysipelotrichaceae bacterium]